MRGKGTLAFVCTLFCTMILGSGYALAATGGGVGAPDDPPPAPSPVSTGPAAPGTGGIPTDGSGAPAPLPNVDGLKIKVYKHGPYKGLAAAPAAAPEAVKKIVEAGNKIAFKPYIYGGGHKSFNDNGYDCSATVSYALHGAGLLDSPLDSTGFFSWGEAGAGQWVTVATKSSHAFMILPGARFDTSGANPGSRWQTSRRPLGSYKLRHPQGL